MKVLCSFLLLATLALTAVAKSTDGVAPAPAEDRFILPKGARVWCA